MLIGKLKIPKDVEIPSYVLERSRSPEIDAYPTEVMGANDWIGCYYAWPHIDDWWVGKFFITLSVKSKHCVGDALSKEAWYEVPRGTLFVIDPMVRHWLFNRDSWRSTRNTPWVGLQWEVPRKRARKVVRDLMQKYNGTWSDHMGERYAKWKVG